MAVAWDPFEPSTCEDPYPVYAQLREQDPWHRTVWGTLAVSRYDDCLQALHDPRLGNDPRGSDEHRQLLEQPLIAGASEDFDLAGFMFRDPPEHTCLRGTVARGFTRATVDRWREPLAAIVEDLCDQILPTGRIDIVNELGPALQTAVMGSVLGLPPKGMAQLRDWRLTSLLAKDVAMATAGALFDDTGAEGTEGAGDGVDELMAWWANRRAARADVLAYLGRRIEKRRRAPQPDTLTMIARALDDPAVAIDGHDAALVAEQVFIAGFETVANLLGNTVAVTASTHPDLWEAMAAGELDPDLVVAETLRWDPPVQVVSRFAREDTVIGEQPVTAGEHVHVLLGSANRDGRRFPEPERFDPTRDDEGLAFSHGRHRCLAAHLARVEAALLIGALSRRAPGLRVEREHLRHRPDLVLRGYQQLIATWS